MPIVTTDGPTGPGLAPAGEGPGWTVLGHRVRLRAIGPERGWSLLEVVAEAGGPPPHRHLWDETFLIREGSAEILLGERWLAAGPGDLVRVEAWQPHTYRAGPAGLRMEVLLCPAGIERFFAELAAAAPTLPPDPAVVLAVMARHGVEPVGPPPG